MKTSTTTGARTATRIVNPSPFPTDLTRALEQVEADVWTDLYRAAAPDDVDACELDVTTVGAATVMTAGLVDVLAFNRVVGLGIGTPATEAMLDAIIQHYDAAAVPRFFVQLSPAASPAALFEWIGRRGLRHYNNWMKLFRSVGDPPEVATSLHVERMGPEHARTFADLVAPAFDWPDAVRPWMARIVGRPGWHHYIAFDGDTPAATAAMHVTGRYGYLGPAATHPDFRRRGAQSALIARRLRDAAALGCEMLISETAEDRPDDPSPSFRNMRRAGFQVAYVRPNYICEPGLCPPGA
jgi:GNAT superfamily N-acetyltransferase